MASSTRVLAASRSSKLNREHHACVALCRATLFWCATVLLGSCRLEWSQSPRAPGLLHAQLADWPVETTGRTEWGAIETIRRTDCAHKLNCTLCTVRGVGIDGSEPGTLPSWK